MEQAILYVLLISKLTITLVNCIREHKLLHRHHCLVVSAMRPGCMLTIPIIFITAIKILTELARSGTRSVKLATYQLLKLPAAQAV